MHVAAYSATVTVLERLVDAGGDLRLHDSAGRSARDWAAARPASRQRTKVLDYLNKAKLTALNSSTRDFLELSMRNRYISLSHIHLCQPFTGRTSTTCAAGMSLQVPVQFLKCNVL